MSTQLLTGMCIVLGALGTWNTWTLYQVNKRLDTIEAQKESKVVTKTTVNNSDVVSYRSSSKNTGDSQKKSPYMPVQKTQQEQPLASAKPELDLSDPDIQEAIAQIADNKATDENAPDEKNKNEQKQCFEGVVSASYLEESPLSL